MSIIAQTLIIGSILFLSNAFSPPSSSRQRISLFQLHVQNHDGSAVEELLSATMTSQDKRDTEAIKSIMSALETSYEANPSPSRFTPLLGLYEVRTVITANPTDNPVGGKWTRSQQLFRTRATFQHLLPLNSTGNSQLKKIDDTAVAEAINIVSLDALNGLLRMTVILRGDVIPLSSDERYQMNTNRTITPLTSLAVRAIFDPPRIYLGRRRKRRRGGELSYSYFPLQVGPSSSVVLDTTYCDSKIRIGRGGTSGSYFLFVTTNKEEANEYKVLMEMRTRMKRTIVKLAMLATASLYTALFGFARVDRWGTFTAKMNIAMCFLQRISIGVSMTTGIALLLLLFSSGGIERDGVSQSQISGIVK
jgi:hypothetical protein